MFRENHAQGMNYSTGLVQIEKLDVIHPPVVKSLNLRNKKRN